MAPGKGAEAVRVVVRARPLSRKEVEDNRQQIVHMNVKSGVAVLTRPGDASDAKDFTFDAVFDDTATQEHVFKMTAADVVDSCLEGFNGTIFCYGQTGAGKSHTMCGPFVAEDGLLSEHRGLLPRSFEAIFNAISDATEDTKYLVRASFLELYNEEIRDLLSKNPKEKCELKDNPEQGVYVKDLSAFVVKSAAEMVKVLQQGLKNRSVGATQMNAESSRSHSIFTVTMETCTFGEDGEGHIRVGKMNMVDLAGSERQSKTGATGDRLKEATKINLSLSALGNVISALVDGRSSYIPYRDSKLTRMLQDSLGGNTKTTMVANVGPADYNYDETLSTLRYAYRAKSIKNKPRVNEDPKNAMIREFQEEIQRLKEQLGVAVDENGEPIRRVEVRDKVVEKIVEKEVIVRKGPSEDEVRAMEQKLQEENERLRAEMQAKREEILAQRDMAKGEMQRLLAEVERKEAESKHTQEAAGQMLSKLKTMEETMLVGTKVMEKAVTQEKELRRAQKELEKRQRREEEMALKRRQQEEQKVELEMKFNSQEDRVNKLTSKLEKLWAKYRRATTEVEDIQQEFAEEREDLLQSIRELRRELQLKSTIIDAFVPSSEVDSISKRARWSEEEDDWILETDAADDVRGYALQNPPSVNGSWRPVTDYARAARAAGDTNPRFQYENVVTAALDMPEAVTIDFTHETIALPPRSHDALKIAFEHLAVKN